MADRNEAARLWTKILELERQPVKSEADFKWKSGEMAKLRAAYASASGTSCAPGNWRENQLKGELKAAGDMLGGRPTDNLTSEDLNNLPPGFERDNNPGTSGR